MSGSGMFLWGRVPGRYVCTRCGATKDTASKMYRHYSYAHLALTAREKGALITEQRRANGWSTGADFRRLGRAA